MFYFLLWAADFVQPLAVLFGITGTLLLFLGGILFIGKLVDDDGSFIHMFAKKWATSILLASFLSFIIFSFIPTRATILTMLSMELSTMDQNETVLVIKKQVLENLQGGSIK